MVAISSSKELSGSITIPGSKGHTIRACYFAALAEGYSYIHNPLTSEDCIAVADAVEMIGAKVQRQNELWIVTGAGKKMHLPEDIIHVGNSATAIYFLTPISALFNGWTIVTGDKSVRWRPVQHMLDALNQLGCESHIARPNVDAPPFMVKGPLQPGLIVTEGAFSQYITGLIAAALLMMGKTEIILKNPKEKSFLHMTEIWLKSLGVPVHFSADYKRIQIDGPHRFTPFDRMMPSDWESAAFPIVAAIITDSEISVNKIDTSDSQGDFAIVAALQSMGADIQIFEDDPFAKTGHLIVRGGKKSRLKNQGKLHGITIMCTNFIDAVPILAVAACFAEGKTVLEDIGLCRRKETDRIVVMAKELSELGATVTETQNSLIICGADKQSKDFMLHGGSVQSYDDHRVAMALAVLGLGLKKGKVQVNDAEVCAMSFPNFFETMNDIGCGFVIKK